MTPDTRAIARLVVATRSPVDEPDLLDDDAWRDDPPTERWGWRAALVMLAASCGLWFGVVAAVRWMF